jgi:putative ABC transport system permease protein
VPIAARTRSLESFAQDLRFALRQFRKAPAFAAVIVTIVALGIGASSAIFSVVNGVLLRPLPYPDANRIVQLWEVGSQGGQMNFPDPDFNDLHARTRDFSAMTEVADFGVVSVVGSREPVRAHAASLGPEFFHVLGVQPVLGRVFSGAEQQENAAPTAVVSYGFWQRAFGGSRDVLGRVIHTAGRAYTIIGVMPAAVDEPVGTEIWSPRGLEGENSSRTAHNWQVIGRLGPGVTLAQAQRDVSGVMRSLRAQYGDQMDAVNGALVPLREQLVGSARPALLILLAASLVLLLIACTNAVNLLVARMAARQGEIAVRTALGAERGRLVRQFLAESLVLAIAGGALGVALAQGGLALLLGLQTGELPRAAEVTLDWPVFAFALGVSVAVATLMAMVAAWRGAHGDVREALSEAQRTLSGAGASYRIRSGLVVGQIAMTLAMLVAAGLLARSFQRLLEVQPGFITSNAVVLDLSMPSFTSQDSSVLTRRVQAYDALLAQLRAIPGVTGVGGVNVMPLSAEFQANGTFLIMTGPNEKIEMSQLETLFRNPARTGNAEFRVSSAGYFETMHIPLLRGRLFDSRDTPASGPVALISKSLADTRWPGRDPLGQVIEYGNMDGDLRPFTVVGVVGDVREANLAAAPRPTFYADYRQRPVGAGDFNFVIGTATTADQGTVMAAARRIVHQVAPDAPPRLRTIEAIVARSVADRRFVLVLVATFGSAALLLATLGIYGLVSFLVVERRRELSIRMALGAAPADILRLVIGQGARLAAAGLVVGALLSLLAVRVLSGLLYGVSATDPVAFGGVTLILGAVALAASWVPAHRAARLPPSEVLRG